MSTCLYVIDSLDVLRKKSLKYIKDGSCSTTDIDCTPPKRRTCYPELEALVDRRNEVQRDNSMEDEVVRSPKRLEISMSNGTKVGCARDLGFDFPSPPRLQTLQAPTHNSTARITEEVCHSAYAE